MKSKQKIVKTISLALIISTVFTLCGVVFLSVFSEKNIDASYDEKLFSLSKTSSYTEYYVDKRERAISLSEYDPKLLCSLSLGEAKKRYIPLSQISQNVVNAFVYKLLFYT